MCSFISGRPAFRMNCVCVDFANLWHLNGEEEAPFNLRQPPLNVVARQTVSPSVNAHKDGLSVVADDKAALGLDVALRGTDSPTLNSGVYEAVGNDSTSSDRGSESNIGIFRCQRALRLPLKNHSSQRACARNTPCAHDVQVYTRKLRSCFQCQHLP